MMIRKSLGGLTAVFAGLTMALMACTAVTQPAIQPTEQVTSQATAVPPPTEIQPTEEPFMADLPDLGAAPEIRNEVWVNADAPATLASAEGKVVLLEFWTFG